VPSCSLTRSLSPPFFFQTNSNTTKTKPAKTTAAAKVATVTKYPPTLLTSLPCLLLSFLHEGKVSEEGPGWQEQR